MKKYIYGGIIVFCAYWLVTNGYINTAKIKAKLSNKVTTVLD